MGRIAENLKIVRGRIEAACARSGRNPEELTLVAVTKTVSPVHMNEAIEAGVTHIGENRVQEAREKFPNVRPVTWHLIGHLQTNKVKHALRIFQWIQSVDSFRLAEKIEQEASRLGKTIPVLLEVKTSPEETKYGVPVPETLELVQKIAVFTHLRIRGLMTIAPFTDEEKLIRESFQTLRRLREEINRAKIAGVEMEHLSMGMSHDFEMAIEEGATMVRIGTAIFGPRN
ncbi:MAG: YggS family pyridoxal phosphate-dependent enzyme [Calditrichaeota bacterium]|nr:YggS family pyridoxal phosphate-dependent enzyme [Calditrichota bacterium]